MSSKRHSKNHGNNNTDQRKDRERNLALNPYEEEARNQAALQRRNERLSHIVDSTKVNGDGKITSSNNGISNGHSVDIPQFKLVKDSKSFKKPHHSVKIVVVGDGGCGKTCLLVSYTQGKFPELYVPTIFENYVTELISPNNERVELSLWDTAGQEEYDRLRPLSYPDVDVLLICYSVDSMSSLHNVRDIWYPEVTHFCPGIPIVLVGTKSDLKRSSEIKACSLDVAKNIQCSAHLRCSAKTMKNVANVFNIALTIAMKEKQLKEKEMELKAKKNRKSRMSLMPLKHTTYNNEDDDDNTENLYSKDSNFLSSNNDYLNGGSSFVGPFEKKRSRKLKCTIL